MVSEIAYNEYKFLVDHANLSYVKNLIQTFYGGSDPYPEGVVDSIYFDSLNLSLYNQCLDGDQVKDKFRIRGYGHGVFSQLHHKQKDMFGVRKTKCRIQTVSMRNTPPDWQALRVDKVDYLDDFEQIMALSSIYGPLIPVLRVVYYRYRFRVQDYRITLDTNIEVSGFNNGVDKINNYMVIPNHVLEIKSLTPRPYLPLLGLTSLPQISFSKFYMGLNLLSTGDIG